MEKTGLSVWLFPYGRIIGAVHARVHVWRTLHALPFAALGALCARRGWPTTTETLLLVVVILFARAYAVSLIRLFKAPFDVANPGEERPGRDPVPRAVWIAFALHAAVALVAASYGLHALTGHLSWILVVFFYVYSATRRYTGFSHFLFGAGIGMVPPSVGIALAGNLGGATPALVAIGAGTALWAAGFDMIFSLAPPLRDPNVPHAFVQAPRFSNRTVRAVAAACHAAAVLLFAWGMGSALGSSLSLAGPLAVGFLLAYGHGVETQKADGGPTPLFSALNFAVGPMLLIGGVVTLAVI